MMQAAADDESNHLPHPPLPDALVKALVSNALPGELDGLSKARLRDIAQFVGEAIGDRRSETPVIHVGKGGSNHGKRLSWIVVNTDDMPFLVDSVAAAISARGDRKSTRLNS